MIMNQNIHWKRVKNLLVFDYGWQEPAKTELWAYDSFQHDFTESPFVEMICFPWATLIDLLRRNQHDKADFYLEALKAMPSKRTLKRATVCQHIYAKDLLDLFDAAQITDLFWSHSIEGELSLGTIKIHPFPLYPYTSNISDDSGQMPLCDRPYFYSFIGAYDPTCYLSDIRKTILSLPKASNAYVAARDGWHFEQVVYDQQILGSTPEAAVLQQFAINTKEYAEVLGKTVFSLCPSGSGPNSIRFWESLCQGSIPVLLSDTWRAPEFINKLSILHLKESKEGLLTWLEEMNEAPSLDEYLRANSLYPNQISVDQLCNMAIPNDFYTKFD